MTLRFVFASAALLASLALAGCSADATSPSSDATEQDVISKPLTNVKVESEKLTWGLAAGYGGDRAHASGIHAFLFDGEAGDEIVAKTNSDTPGTLYILEQTEAGFTVLKKASSGVTGEAKTTLRAAGTYAIAVELRIEGKPDPNALFPESFSVAVTLTGKPSSPAKQLALNVRDIWTNATDFYALEETFTSIDEKTLPPTALTEWKKLDKDSVPKPIAATWKVGNATVFVVESRDEVSMIISFYDAQGTLLASATASEGSEIAWTK